MLGSSSHVSGSSSSSRSHESLAKTPNRARSGKVSQWCGCGMRPVLRWSGTESNPERPFFGCPNYNLGRGGVASLCGHILKKKNAYLEKIMNSMDQNF
ncbi:hypothetical protein PIB30_073915 [Stylosanthes scabra]|uniref:Zinc finger GRF-type domain-containing protein n=1 Tax=Stylosanthes scabra TaxID=79078 RepID=A0ABU6VRD1_9FABA|nr:hypothetical protein [Stylosanthes scabra]